MKTQKFLSFADLAALNVILNTEEVRKAISNQTLLSFEEQAVQNLYELLKVFSDAKY